MVTIDISQFFEAVSDESWLKTALKSLKLEETSELEKRLNFRTCEGVTLKSNYKKLNETIGLSTFPTERKLVRFSDTLEKNELSAGVDFFISSSAGSSAHIKNLLCSGEKLNSSSYLNLYETFLYFKQDIVALKKYIEENKDTQFETYIDSTIIHNAGGSIVQELGFILSILKFNQEVLQNPTNIIIEIASDSLMFNGIAKLRALRFMIESLQEQCDLKEIKLLCRNSKREQTLYDPWMNMLRNTTSCAAAFMGGADYIAMDSYDSIASEYSEYVQSELGKRQSRNTFHILNEESFLSYVSDPGQGSVIIESLTKEYIDMSFEYFKKIEASSKSDLGVFSTLNKFSLEVELVAKERFKRVAKSKSIIAGVNNYANTEESLTENFKVELNLNRGRGLFPLRRVSSEFECLRQKLENKKLKIRILAYGPQSKLSARIMFCANFFEVLGSKCEIVYLDEGAEIILPKADANVFCSLDDLYPKMISLIKGGLKNTSPIFIAGNKYKNESCENIFMGQNILELLSETFLKEEK